MVSPRIRRSNRDRGTARPIPECGAAPDRTPKKADREWKQGPWLVAGDAGSRPGDDYNRRGDWMKLLGPYDWKVDGRRGDVIDLTRPGKRSGVSATVGHCKTQDGCPRLYVFSSSAAPFEPGTSYSLFQAYTLLKHDGDFKAAARDLGEQGYGDQIDLDAKPTCRTRRRPATPVPKIDSKDLYGPLGEWCES